MSQQRPRAVLQPRVAEVRKTELQVDEDNIDPRLREGKPVSHDKQAKFWRQADQALRTQWEEAKAHFSLRQITPQEQPFEMSPSTIVSRPVIVMEEPHPQQQGIVDSLEHSPSPYSAPAPRLHMILPVRAYGPQFEHPHTYPRSLLAALEQCDKQIAQPKAKGRANNLAYYVVRGRRRILECEDMQQANLEVVRHFIDYFWSHNMEEPKFTVLSGGGLCCTISTTDWRDSHDSVYAEACLSSAT